MVVLANPVRGHIYGHNEVAPAGAYRVTATFGQIDADHPTPHLGIDIGNGSCGFDLLAMHNGTVVEAFKDAGNGAWIARYQLTEDPSLIPGIAHMPSLEVSVGQIVRKGDVIGHCGMSGASACHLHQGVKRNGVEFDWWPLLAQNQEEAVTFVALEKFDPPRTWDLVASAAAPATITGYKFDPTTLAVLDELTPTAWTIGSSAHADQRLQVPGNVAYLHVTDGVYAGLWVAEDGKSVKLQAVSSGHSDAELAEAVKRARANGISDAAKAAAATV